MKTLYICAALAFFGMASAQKTIEIKEFKKLAVSGDINLTLIKSSESKLVLEDYDEEDPEIDFSEDKGNLAISGDGRATLYYKDGFEGLAATEDCVVNGKDVIKTDSFSLAATTDAKVALVFDVKNLKTAASSDAHITLTGSAKQHKVAVESDAVLKASELETETTDVAATFDAVAFIKAKKTVNAVATSDAVIEIYGSPEKVNKTAEGDAVIKLAK